MRNEISLILHNIRSTHNVGSIFRTADAAGVSKMYLVGLTPAPIDRFGRERKDVAKVSLGAEKTVKWEARKSIEELISELKKKDFEIVALEQSSKSIDFKKFKPRGNTALIVGNEVDGILEDILNTCDKVIEIPMKGKLARNRLKNDGGKESLNVSVATGIALFQLTANS